MLVTIVAFLLILSVLVLIHELGHYLTAKFFGVKVEEFGFGFPPRAWGKKIGETIYSVNFLPIGGFVKLFGEDEAGGGRLSLPAKSVEPRAKSDKSYAQSSMPYAQKRAFFARPVWQRFVIVFAGVFMNFVLAVGIWTYLVAAEGIPTPGNSVVVAQVAPNSPAQKAGLKVNDVIVSLNNMPVTNPNQIITYTQKHLGQTMTLQLKTHNSQVKTVSLTPRVHYPAGQGAMGVAIAQTITYQKYPWYVAPYVGLCQSLSQMQQMVSMLGQVVAQLVIQRQVPQGLAGPVGIAQLTGEVVQIGPFATLSLVALLSLNLAVLNVLPIPALDGGRLFFILFEGITRHKVSPKFEGYAHAIGMIALLILIAVITFHDIFRIFTGQSLLPK